MQLRTGTSVSNESEKDNDWKDIPKLWSSSDLNIWKRWSNNTILVLTGISMGAIQLR